MVEAVADDKAVGTLETHVIGLDRHLALARLESDPISLDTELA